jgi:hypothetical protein|tara:strand:- start:444 stop:569 length:126 start_codon:yes stop_codon:yes gene_type:complete
VEEPKKDIKSIKELRKRKRKNEKIIAQSFWNWIFARRIKYD